MASLTEVVEQLKVQNNTLESVNSTVVAMLKEDIAARKATERGKGKAEEDRRERAKVRKKPKSIVGGLRQGVKEGLGLGALSGLLGLVGGGLATIFKALVPGFVAAATTRGILTGAAGLFGKVIGRSFLIGIMVTWGETIFKKFLDSIDPNDDSIFDLSEESKTKFAGLLNFATMGLLAAGLFGRLISLKFKALLAGGIIVGGFLYNALLSKLDDSVLEQKFNETFNIDFGGEIMAGIGALVGTALTATILNSIRKRLGLAVLGAAATPATAAAAAGLSKADKTAAVQKAAREGKLPKGYKVQGIGIAGPDGKLAKFDDVFEAMQKQSKLKLPIAGFGKALPFAGLGFAGFDALTDNEQVEAMGKLGSLGATISRAPADIVDAITFLLAGGANITNLGVNKLFGKDVMRTDLQGTNLSEQMRQRQIETQKLLNEYYEANPGPTVALVEALTAALAANQRTSTPEQRTNLTGRNKGRADRTRDPVEKQAEALAIE
tara:strand:- start:4658 stop:6139 length:1482 start_codon:yes stop_codon:yes gene_type:complete